MAEAEPPGSPQLTHLLRIDEKRARAQARTARLARQLGVSAEATHASTRRHGAGVPLLFAMGVACAPSEVARRAYTRLTLTLAAQAEHGAFQYRNPSRVGIVTGITMSSTPAVLFRLRG